MRIRAPYLWLGALLAFATAVVVAVFIPLFAMTGIEGLTGFSDPLDLVEDVRNGNVYVVEFGSKRLTLLRPIAGGTSQRVYRQVVPQSLSSSTCQPGT